MRVDVRGCHLLFWCYIYFVEVININTAAACVYIYIYVSAKHIEVYGEYSSSERDRGKEMPTSIFYVYAHQSPNCPVLYIHPRVSSALADPFSAATSNHSTAVLLQLVGPSR